MNNSYPIGTNIPFDRQKFYKELKTANKDRLIDKGPCPSSLKSSASHVLIAFQAMADLAENYGNSNTIPLIPTNRL